MGACQAVSPPLRRGTLLHLHACPLDTCSSAPRSVRATVEGEWPFPRRCEQSVPPAGRHTPHHGHVPACPACPLSPPCPHLYFLVCCAVLCVQVVSKDVFIKLRAQTEQRRRQGWGSIDWQLLDADKLDKHIKQVQARCVCMCVRVRACT